MKITVPALLLSTAIVGCTTPVPVRSDPGAFFQLRSVMVPKDKRQEFSGCVLDGFTRVRGFVGGAPRQELRPKLIRIEQVQSGSGLILISVDINDDGQVGLYESKVAALVSTKAEIAAFDDCVMQLAALS